MKKVLIISYFFPPAYFVGGHRIASWAKYLHKFGVYPIIITRRWNENQAEITDAVIDNTYKHEKFDSHEIYYLPNPITLRDKLHQQKKFGLLRKVLTLKELFGTYFFLSANKMYAEFYKKAVEIIQNEKIDTLIISGKPFNSFHIGYKLKNRFSHLKWIPDYRDEWTTHALFKLNTASYLRTLEKWFDKKWCSNAIYFLATTYESGLKISKVVEKPFQVILNGYDGEINPNFIPNKSSKIIILYIGTIYANQNFEPYLEEAISLYKEGIPIQLHWAGIDLNPEQGQRLRKYQKEYPELIIVHPFLSKEELRELYDKCDFLLLISYSNSNNVMPVKLLEYLRENKPIFLWNNNKGVIERVIKETQSGLIFNDALSWKKFMLTFEESKRDFSFFNPNFDAIKKYSREEQSKELAKFLRSI